MSDGGYVFAMGACIVCKRPFTFNPVRVPSTSIITGTREPVCRPCMDWINAKRAALGLAAFPILPDAYEPCSESDL
jgi:hypothetical protein